MKTKFRGTVGTDIICQIVKKARQNLEIEGLVSGRESGHQSLLHIPMDTQLPDGD